MTIFGYPKIWHLGHRSVEGMFAAGNVYVQEKYDGSQFSFTKDIETGELKFRSRRVDLDPDDHDKLFAPTVEHLKSVTKQITSGWVYRGEAFVSNKHNTKKYGRVPKGHLVLFDIDVGHHAFLSPEEVSEIAFMLTVEPCHTLELLQCSNPTPEQLDAWLGTQSSLEETKIEGVVFKNYGFYTSFDHPAFAKFVSEEFKEEHKKNLDWKQGKDLFDALGSTFATEARWRKSVHRLRDDGGLEESPRDIGRLLKELNTDLLYEHGDELKTRVWKSAWKKISSASTRGFPEWYKRELAFPGRPRDAGSDGPESDSRTGGVSNATNGGAADGRDYRDVMRPEAQGDGDSGENGM